MSFKLIIESFKILFLLFSYNFIFKNWKDACTRSLKVISEFFIICFSYKVLLATILFLETFAISFSSSEIIFLSEPFIKLIFLISLTNFLNSLMVMKLYDQDLSKLLLKVTCFSIIVAPIETATIDDKISLV